MKDPNYVPDWAAEVAQRLRLGGDDNDDDNDGNRTSTNTSTRSNAKATPSQPSQKSKRSFSPPASRRSLADTSRFSGSASHAHGSSSPRSTLARFRDLPSSAVLLLFTPVVVPSGFSTLDGNTEGNEEKDSRKNRNRNNKNVSVPTTSNSRSSNNNNPSLAIPALQASNGNSNSNSNSKTQTDTDPFELLGKALALHHPRIRHVPYVPAAGFTETHQAFLEQADGVVVVTCEPASAEPTNAELTNAEAEVEVEDAKLDALLAQQASFAHEAATALSEIGGKKQCVPMVNFHFGDDQWTQDVTGYLNVWGGEGYGEGSVGGVVGVLFGG
ncbi:hypothetical protein B0A50_07783 [Salinomyces thailandicus]|uniref:Uncharacterized protein n=1 Tax=Salinomyces thailandicus TaxID=706561 RepID=A0A4U0TLA2_9PEZI|nr:hypothetical protein B0A50_07783 [Salinomyces thailandica]